MYGVIRFDGRDISGRSPVEVARSGLVQMSDSRSVFRGLTVDEHFRLRHRGQTLDRDIAYDYFPALQKLAKRRAGLLSIVRRFADDTGAGVLLIEQHVQMALSVADRGYVLVHGDVVLEGDAERLTRDRHLLTASYMGEAHTEQLVSAGP